MTPRYYSAVQPYYNSCSRPATVVRRYYVPQVSCQTQAYSQLYHQQYYRPQAYYYSGGYSPYHSGGYGSVTYSHCD